MSDFEKKLLAVSMFFAIYGTTLLFYWPGWPVFISYAASLLCALPVIVKQIYKRLATK